MGYNEKYVYKFKNINFDIIKIQYALNEILDRCDIHSSDLQINFTHKQTSITREDKLYEGNGGYFPIINGKYDKTQPIRQESDYICFNDEFKDTFFYDIYNILSENFFIGRMRILILPIKSCMSWHRDLECRIHIPIYSSKGSFITFCTDDENNYYTAHLPADGSAYMCDVRTWHSASNGSYSGFIFNNKDVRVNLLCNIIEAKNNITQIKEKILHQPFKNIEK